jgi:hypothetical protein
LRVAGVGGLQHPQAQVDVVAGVCDVYRLVDVAAVGILLGLLLGVAGFLILVVLVFIFLILSFPDVVDLGFPILSSLVFGLPLLGFPSGPTAIEILEVGL